MNDYLGMAIDLAVKNVKEGGGPFGAILEMESGVFFAGVNRVTASSDPTAHAEVTAIREACSRLDTFDLNGSTLYTSCAPCPMCLSSAIWANVRYIVYAASPEDAGAAGFSDAAMYHDLSATAAQAPFSSAPVDLSKLDLVVVRHAEHPRALAPFEAWAAYSERTEY